MRRLLLVAATVAAFVTPSVAHASDTCDARSCVHEIGEAVCGDHGCGPVARCHYWTDYPICLY